MRQTFKKFQSGKFVLEISNQSEEAQYTLSMIDVDINLAECFLYSVTKDEMLELVDAMNEFKEEILK